jgi:succinate dehydrogenase/fumarate reductase flavoprotein subunit
MLEPLAITMDSRTGGPAVDQNMMTSLPGLFSCGNALHVNTLVDYVSESGAIAGKAAAAFALGEDAAHRFVPLMAGSGLLYAVPQRLDLESVARAVIYFRSSCTMENAVLKLSCGRDVLLERKYPVVRPPETERIVFDPAKLPPRCTAVTIELQEGK